jgi:hypothetical protein
MRLISGIFQKTTKSEHYKNMFGYNQKIYKSLRKFCFLIFTLFYYFLQIVNIHENQVVVNSLEDAEKELGTELLNTIIQYKQGRGDELAENEADNHVFREFILYEKASKIFAQRIKEIMIKLVEKFYDNECKNEIVLLFDCGTEIPPAKSYHPKDNSDKTPTTHLEQHVSTNTPTGHDDSLVKRQTRIEKLLDDMLQEEKKFTLKRLIERADHVFNLEIGDLLGNAIKFLEEQKLGIDKMLPAEIKEEYWFKPKFLDPQTVAMEYIDKNRTRLTKEKSRRGTIDRMLRVFDRYIDMRKQAYDCLDEILKMTGQMAESLTWVVRRNGEQRPMVGKMEEGQPTMVGKMVDKLVNVFKRNEQQPTMESELAKELEGAQWKELKAKVYKLKGEKLPHQTESGAIGLVTKLVEGLEPIHFENHELLKLKILLDLKQELGINGWSSLRVKVHDSDDTKQRQILIEEKNKLQEAIKRIENHRKEKSKNIQAIYYSNEAMREFVKGNNIDIIYSVEIFIIIIRPNLQKKNLH